MVATPALGGDEVSRPAVTFERLLSIIATEPENLMVVVYSSHIELAKCSPGAATGWVLTSSRPSPASGCDPLPDEMGSVSYARS